MSHQRFPSSTEPIKEPHSVSLKVLRLARPSLVFQYPIEPPSYPSQSATTQQPASHNGRALASLAYPPPRPRSTSTDNPSPSPSPPDTNSDPFVLSPILNLPASFGSTYVGETFSCTLCANNDVLGHAAHDDDDDSSATIIPASMAGVFSTPGGQQGVVVSRTTKKIRDVRIDAEMKTPAASVAQKLDLFGCPPPPPPDKDDDHPDKHHDDDDDDAKPVAATTTTAATTTSSSSSSSATSAGVDLEPGHTLQRVLSFHLKEKGNHVLAVTVSYYEATETSGRTRTFRKLYQFVCKPALVVRTKVGTLPGGQGAADKRRRWVLEAQLENCSEETVQLERVFLDTDPGLVYEDLNWDAVARTGLGREHEQQANTQEVQRMVAHGVLRPLLHPGEVEQVCFVISEESEKGAHETDGRVMFGIMGVGWRGEMGSAGFLSTGRLGSKVV